MIAFCWSIRWVTAALEAKPTGFTRNGEADVFTVNDKDTRQQSIKKGTVFLNGGWHIGAHAAKTHHVYIFSTCYKQVATEDAIAQANDLLYRSINTSHPLIASHHLSRCSSR